MSSLFPPSEISHTICYDIYPLRLNRKQYIINAQYFFIQYQNRWGRETLYNDSFM